MAMFVADDLFGNCQQGTIDTFRYVPNSDQLRSLELEIVHLVEDGHTWDDLYTQCVLGNVLLSMRTDNPYDPSFCDSPATSDGAEGQRQEMLNKDFLLLLQNYIDRTHPNEDGGFVDTPGGDASDAIEPPVIKKDTFLTIHKYLKSHKRNELPNDAWENIGSSQPVEGEKRADNDDFLSQLSASEIALLVKYFKSISEDRLPDVDVPGDYESTRVVAPSTDSYLWEEEQPSSSKSILKGKF